ncbi:hypothetical protein GCM10020331_002910 [Ectobacillus funiculus]
MKEKGKYYIVADKYFASSKICNGCGHKKDKLTLSERIYRCTECGTKKTDRDYNAALNLKQYGTHVFEGNERVVCIMCISFQIAVGTPQIQGYGHEPLGL